MKKALLLVVAMLFVAGVASAHDYTPGPVPLVGLYVDEAHSNHCPTIPAPYTQVDIYVFFLPSVNGANASELKLRLEGTYLALGEVLNSSIVTLNMGQLLVDGESFSYGGVCLNDWHWPTKQPVLVMDTATPGGAFVEPKQQTNFYGTSNCQYVSEAATICAEIYWNQACEEIVATEDATWGSIKSMFK